MFKCRQIHKTDHLIVRMQFSIVLHVAPWLSPNQKPAEATLIFKLTHYLQPHHGHSHMVCSRPCHWTDPSAVAVEKRTENIHSWLCLTHRGERKLFGVVPDTDRSCVRWWGVCRSTFLCLNHRSFLQAGCPAGYRYKLPKHTKKLFMSDYMRLYNFLSLVSVLF